MKLKQEYDHFKAHLGEYLRDHPGEFVVIRDRQVLGFHPTEKAAVDSMAKEPLGTFLVKQCVPTDQDVAEYHSRAVFA